MRKTELQEEMRRHKNVTEEKKKTEENTAEQEGEINEDRTEQNRTEKTGAKRK